MNGRRLSQPEMSLIKDLLLNAEDGIFKRLAEYLILHINSQDAMISELRIKIMEGEGENGR